MGDVTAEARFLSEQVDVAAGVDIPYIVEWSSKWVDGVRRPLVKGGVALGSDGEAGNFSSSVGLASASGAF